MAVRAVAAHGLMAVCTAVVGMPETCPHPDRLRYPTRALPYAIRHPLSSASAGRGGCPFRGGQIFPVSPGIIQSEFHTVSCRHTASLCYGSGPIPHMASRRHERDA